MKTTIKWAIILALCWVIFYAEIAKADNYEALAHTLNVADTLTSYFAFKDPDAYEINSLYGRHPSNSTLIIQALIQSAFIRWMNYTYEDGAFGFNVGYSAIKGMVVANNFGIIYQSKF